MGVSDVNEWVIMPHAADPSDAGSVSPISESKGMVMLKTSVSHSGACVCSIAARAEASETDRQVTNPSSEIAPIAFSCSVPKVGRHRSGVRKANVAVAVEIDAAVALELVEASFEVAQARRIARGQLTVLVEICGSQQLRYKSSDGA